MLNSHSAQFQLVIGYKHAVKLEIFCRQIILLYLKNAESFKTKKK